jgi:catechol-2,3-dioxygenase
MLDWYKKVFDARIQFQNPMLAFLTYDDEHHRFAFANMSAIDPAGTELDHVGKIGVDHVAYAYRSLRELLENWEQLKTIGITPYWSLHHGITVSLYYADPDGNQMEFQVDSYLTNEEANAFMAGPGYAMNPVGVEFDPAAWLAQLRSGAPETDYLVRTVHEPIPAMQGNAVRS